jgi:flagellar basal-body rod protein FlgG
MIKGIYRAASGMLPRIRKQEVTANNLANVNTPGFKRQDVFMEELSRARQKLVPRQERWEIPMMDDVYTDYSQGVLECTGDDLNVGLDGDGFLVVQSQDGQLLYTRFGSFTLSPDGSVVTPEGHSLMTDAGPLVLAPGADLRINLDGAVAVNGEQFGKLAIVGFERPDALERLGGSVYRAPRDAVQIEPERLFVRQGYLERANVDVIREMTDMIASFREYESNQKAIQILDESVEKTVNRVGAKR